MAIDVRPATVFDDVATLVGPKRPGANVCWCLSYRLPSKENVALRGPPRGRKVAALMQRGPVGVLAYDGDDVVGWAAVVPRAETAFARSHGAPAIEGYPVDNGCRHVVGAERLPPGADATGAPAAHGRGVRRGSAVDRAEPPERQSFAGAG